jgi:hypothetical protein
MKSIFQRITSALFLIVSALVLTACATHGQKETASIGDGDKFFAAPKVRIDRLVVKSALAEGTVCETDLVQIAWFEPSGKMVTAFDKDLKREVPAVTRFNRERCNGTLGEKVVVTFVGGVIPSIINGEYAKEVAKQASCKAGSVCDSTVLMQDINNSSSSVSVAKPVAAAISGSSSNASAGTCPSSGCTSTKKLSP